MNTVFDECVKMAENKVQLDIFLSWWNGISIYSKDENGIDRYRAERYQDCTDSDWYNAHSIILYATSCGYG